MTMQHSLADYQGRLPRLRVAAPVGDAEMIRVLRGRLARAAATIMQLQSELDALRLDMMGKVTPAQVLRNQTNVIAIWCDDRLRELFDNVVRETGISKELLCGPLRHRPIVQARVLFIGVAVAQRYSAVQIGLALGFRDPSTIQKLVPRGRAMVAAHMGFGT